MKFKKNIKTYLKISILFVISVGLLVKYTALNQSATANAQEYKKNLDRNIKVLNNEKNETNTKKIVLSSYALQNGISDTTIYIYTSGTEFNDTAIYNSILSAQKIGSSTNVKILVLFDRKNNVNFNDFIETKLFLITKDSSDKIVSSEISNLGKLDTSRPQGLYDLLSFGMTNFPAKKNILILDGIGKGPTGLIFDESSNRYLSTQDLESALSNIYYSNGTIFDTVIIHSSFGASLELISSLHKFSRYIIATPSFTKLSSLNYGKIVEVANQNVGKSPLQTSQSIYTEIFGKQEYCSLNENFKLYDTEKIKNLTVGVETLAALYFKDETGTLENDIRNTISQTTKLTDHQEDLSVYSFDNFVDRFTKGSNEALKIGGEKMKEDLGKIVINSSSFCNNNTLNLTISLPEDSSSKLANNIKYVGYGDIQSLKEMLRSISNRDTDILKDALVIKSDTENLYVKYDDNYLYCYAGYVDGDKYYVVDQSMGMISENIFKCDKNKPKSLNKILFKLNSKPLIGNLTKTVDGAYQIEVIGDGIRNFNFEVRVNNLEFLQIGEFIDSKGQSGFYYSNKVIQSGQDLSLNSGSLIYGVSLIRERQENEIIKLINPKQTTEDLFTTTYNFFSIPAGFSTVNYEASQVVYSPNISTTPVSVNFSNINSYLSVSEASFSKTRKSFTYYEFIYINATGNKLKFDYKDNEVPFGGDVKYYKGEILPDENIVKFWDDWYANSI